MIYIKDEYLGKNDRLITEQELESTSMNERVPTRFSVGTILDFTGQCPLICRTTSGRNKLIIWARKNGEYGRIHASSLLRVPWLDENRRPLRGQTELQDKLLECAYERSPGSKLWHLIKGRKVIVIKGRLVNIVAK